MDYIFGYNKYTSANRIREYAFDIVYARYEFSGKIYLQFFMWRVVPTYPLVFLALYNLRHVIQHTTHKLVAQSRHIKILNFNFG